MAINKITTIQELTQEAYVNGIFGILFNEGCMSRNEIFNMIEGWGKEFDDAHKDYEWCGDYYDEIDEFIAKKYVEIHNKYKK